MATYPPANAITGLALATSANGTTRNGATLSIAQYQPGSLAVRCYSECTTSSVVPSYTFQVSSDGTNWEDLCDPEGAVLTDTHPTGTGSAVLTTRAVPIPLAAWSYPYFRGRALLSGAATAAADKTSVTYRAQTYPTGF